MCSRAAARQGIEPALNPRRPIKKVLRILGPGIEPGTFCV